MVSKMVSGVLRKEKNIGAKKNPAFFIFAFFVLCFMLRLFEILVLRTDQSIIGEAFIHKLLGNASRLVFYVTSYGGLGNTAMQGGFVFILICIAGNTINVVMEEGVFRGLFLKLAEEKYSFLKACLFLSCLFGLWHIALILLFVIILMKLLIKRHSKSVTT